MTTGLFKYFGTNADKLERFTHGQVYLTPPKYFNDPWDFKLRSEPYTEQQVTKEISPLLPPEAAREFFRMDASTPNFLEGEAGELQNGLSKIVGLVCLTEKPLDRLMWAHYGESHRGFAAEFQHGDEGKSHEGFRLRGGPFGTAVKVNYLPKQPLLKRDLSNMEEVCLTKHECWKYEDEWRVIEPLKAGEQHPAKKGFLLSWFRPTHLLRVILGLQTTPEVSFQLRQMLNHREYEHVRKEEAYINPESRELDSRPLPW